VTKANSLLEKIEASWNDLFERVTKLGPGGLLVAAPDGWAVKDHLAHVAAWEHSLLGLIEGRDRLAAMGLQPMEKDTDLINAAVQKLHADETPEQVLKYFRESHAQLTAALGKLSDADLRKPYSHFQPSVPEQEAPVIGWVAGDTWEHYAEHIAWIDQLIKESSAAR
jgi:uncharacterized damage-inducible protein DinB